MSEGTINLPDPIPTVVTQPIDQTGDALVTPIVDHTEKITRIEERQAQHQEEMIRQLSELEERLRTASSSQVEGLISRINALEEKLTASARVEATPHSVEIVPPAIVTSPEPVEKIRQGLIHRRKAKRKKHE